MVPRLPLLPLLPFFLHATAHSPNTQAQAPKLQQITDFGENPTNVTFYLHEPSSASQNSPLLVYPHWCHGTALDAFNNKPWRSIADKSGFRIIYPSSPHLVDGCWDVSSPETLLHDGGGDSLGIANMVRWTIQERDVDEKRVFVAGISSGGMMTNVLLATYPELFAAGAALAGVPPGCFASEGIAAWSDDCATGKIKMTAEEWAARIHAMSPDYSGPRPKMQIFHGAKDTTVNPTNFYEEEKAWRAVLGTGEDPVSVEEGVPSTGWTKKVYGEEGQLETFIAAGLDHNVPDMVDELVRFFELDCREDCFSRETLEGWEGKC